jgi:ribonucleoside-diphosphate reductase alpha chain
MQARRGSAGPAHHKKPDAASSAAKAEAANAAQADPGSVSKTTTLKTGNIVGVCPDCGGALWHIEGCMVCKSCGYSKCG